jgi:hypothetical protein
MRNLCIDEIGGVKNEKKGVLQFEKNVFHVLLFFSYSFGFAFQT